MGRPLSPGGSPCITSNVYGIVRKPALLYLRGGSMITVLTKTVQFENATCRYRPVMSGGAVVQKENQDAG